MQIRKTTDFVKEVFEIYMKKISPDRKPTRLF